MDVYASVLPEVDQGAADMLDRALRSSGPNRVRRFAAGPNDTDPASETGLTGLLPVEVMGFEPAASTLRKSPRVFVRCRLIPFGLVRCGTDDGP